MPIVYASTRRDVHAHIFCDAGSLRFFGLTAKLAETQKRGSPMGMFDTFHIQDCGRPLAIQSKQFAQVLGEYRLGDFVEFEQDSPTGVTAWIEGHKQDWRDPACPLEWVVILLVDGCFLDAYLTETEADARHAAEVMVKLWQSPERQTEAFKRHARDHYEARVRHQRALGQISALLSDYVEWEQSKAEGQDTSKGRFGFLRHDFDKENWDWALAKVLLRQEAYKEQVPAKYAVAAKLENATELE